MSNQSGARPYGHQDTSYKAAGGEKGLRRLSEEFYDIMGSLPKARKIREMHMDDLSVMIDKLALFLSLWLGGPKTYSQKYKFLGMPKAHEHLAINEEERDAWLTCMDLAVERQPFERDFKDYLKHQFRFPAEIIRKTSRN